MVDMGNKLVQALDKGRPHHPSTGADPQGASGDLHRPARSVDLSNSWHSWQIF